MSKFVITSADQIPALVSELMDQLDSGKKPVVTISDKRSLDANSQVWVWVPLIAEFMGYTVPETNQVLKLDHGLPIILADTEHGPKVKFILDGVNFFNRCRENQLKIIEILPVTRLFSTKQHNAYRDSIQVHYVNEGLYLEYLNG